MNKTESKLNFKRPSGESRLSEESISEISKVETQRFTIDLPRDLALALKMKAAKERKSMRDICITLIKECVKDNK